VWPSVTFHFLTTDPRLIPATMGYSLFRHRTKSFKRRALSRHEKGDHTHCSDNAGGRGRGSLAVAWRVIRVRRHPHGRRRSLLRAWGWRAVRRRCLRDRHGATCQISRPFRCFGIPRGGLGLVPSLHESKRQLQDRHHVATSRRVAVGSRTYVPSDRAPSRL
jgi:hypothetical protein